MNLRWAVLLLFVLLLSGCMYPDSQRKEQQMLPVESVTVVQAAVDRFHEQTGVLPIKNSEMDTPLYQKYVVDFQQLLGGYLGQIPAAAFEQGGIHYFVMIDVEEEPKVRLLHLPSMKVVDELQRKVNTIRREQGSIPGDQLQFGAWYTLDAEAVKPTAVSVVSPISGQTLPVIVHEDGRVAIDYSSDIMQLLQQQEITEPNEQMELLSLLAEHSYYVPAGSFPYYFHDGRPVIEEKN